MIEKVKMFFMLMGIVFTLAIIESLAEAYL